MSKFEITNDAFGMFVWWERYSDTYMRRFRLLPPSDALNRAIEISKDFWAADLGYEHRFHKLQQSDADRRPVCYVGQYGAQVFCQWLTARTGRLYRLPTEAEWEYAARADTKTAYFFGDDPKRLGEYAWFAGNSKGEGPFPVGQKKPNAWGLYDMYGNVAEWTLDGWKPDYGQFAGKTSESPWVRRQEYGSEDGGVVRGGDWKSAASAMRSASRRQRVDESRDGAIVSTFDFRDGGETIGFRIVSPVETLAKSDGRESYLGPKMGER